MAVKVFISPSLLFGQFSLLDALLFFSLMIGSQYFNYYFELIYFFITDD